MKQYSNRCAVMGKRVFVNKFVQPDSLPYPPDFHSYAINRFYGCNKK